MIYAFFALLAGLIVGYLSKIQIGGAWENIFSLTILLFVDVLVTGICAQLSNKFSQRSFWLSSICKLFLLTLAAYLGQLLQLNLQLALTVILVLDIFRTISWTSKFFLKK